jgi:signal transduction histidine kinase
MPLSQKKRELKTVLENISDGVLFIDNQGVIRVYNRTLSKMLSINEDLSGENIFLLPKENPIRQGVFRADAGFPGPFCWERNRCAVGTDCPGRESPCCRCWAMNACETALSENVSCIQCDQYRNVRPFLEKPKELELGDKIVSVVSSFIEYDSRDEIWEVIVFKDVSKEKLDAVVKLANATAHELRQPMQIISSCIALLGNNIENRELSDTLENIKESCYRMDKIIEMISRITKYKTKPYLNNETMLDLDLSSDSSNKYKNSE